VPGNAWSGQGPQRASQTNGLIGPAPLTDPNLQKLPNDLQRPVWLRLVRDGLLWTGYTCWDGQHWTATGAPVAVETASCWSGVFACAHDASFAGRGHIRMVLDHLSFAVDTAAPIGRP